MMFATLDALILKKFQKFADLFQDATGLNNFWITRLLLFLLCLIHLLLNSLPLIISLINGHFAPLLNTALLVVIMVGLFWYVQRVEVKCFKDSPMKNELERSFVGVRSSFMFISSPAMLASVISSIGDARFTLIDGLVMLVCVAIMDCGVYFLSCTPKPPKKSKVKKFIEKLSTSLSSKQIVVQTVRA